jgi:hypothetical protein
MLDNNCLSVRDLCNRLGELSITSYSSRMSVSLETFRHKKPVGHTPKERFSCLSLSQLEATTMKTVPLFLDRFYEKKIRVLVSSD